MKAKESISFPMDFETYYAQYCACVRRCAKAEREERLSKTSKGRRFAEQFLLFLGMAALAFYWQRAGGQFGRFSPGNMDGGRGDGGAHSSAVFK